jgi:signal peptide peptidase SppA
MRFDLSARFAGQVLALDPDSVPALAATAAARAESLTVQQAATLQAGPRGRDQGAPLSHRAGATAIVPIFGLITGDPLLKFLTGGCSADEISAALRSAVADETVGRIALLVNSPGGEVGLIPELAAQIRAARAIKPTVAIARTMMASAAFWLAASAGEVWSTPSGQIGAVGCFCCHVDASGANAKAGLVPTYVSTSKEKVEGSSDAPLSADARAFLQSRVDAVGAQFVQDLAAGRGIPAARVRANFGNGRSFGALDAQARGMVDRVGTLEELLQTAPALNGGSGRGRLSAGIVETRRLAVLVDAGATEREIAEQLAVVDALAALSRD